MIVNHNLKIHEQITPESWHQGESRKRLGGVVVGMCLVEWITERYNGTIMKTYREVREAIDGKPCVLSVWNDARERTFPEVLEALRKADV